MWYVLPTDTYNNSILALRTSNINVNGDLFWKIYVSDVRKNTDVLF